MTSLTAIVTVAWFDTAPDASAIFTYHATDGLLSSAPATVTINITGVANAGPAAGDDAATQTRNATTAINIGLNDSDADGIDWATLSIVAGPGKGAVVNTGGGTVNYIANGKGGSDSFQYTVEDDTTLGAVSNVATVTLTR